jgi:preprotein translocase SecE subunit
VAKTRAQRKAERRAREARAAREAERSRDADVRAQERTQVPESADVIEAELAERGADLEALTETSPEPAKPAAKKRAAPTAEAAPEAPPDRTSRRAKRREERDRERRRKESEKRRRAPAEPQERQRGAVIGFLVSCWAELKRVQWPDRETLIQASAVTLLFIAVAAAYLGALDAAFNWLVQRIL